MSYVKTVWKNRTVQHPRRYTTATEGEYLTLTPAPGSVSEEGTPLDADNLNHLEDGVAALDEALELLGGNGAAKLKIGEDTYTLRLGASGAAGYITIELES